MAREAESVSKKEHAREEGGRSGEAGQRVCSHVEILLDIDYVDDYIDSCIPAAWDQRAERRRGQLEDVEAELVESDQEVEAIFINHEDVAGPAYRYPSRRARLNMSSPVKKILASLRGSRARGRKQPAVEQNPVEDPLQVHRSLRQERGEEEAVSPSAVISPGEKVRMWSEEILPNFESVIRKKWVHALWKQGIPWNLRQQVWPRAIGNKLDLDHHKFESLAMVVDGRSFFIPGIDIINNDLPRTKLLDRDVNEHQLRVLLCTVSALQPQVGYVQGMSYLGAIFLLFMPPAEAFVCLGNLLSCRFFPSFLQMDAEKIELRWRVFEVLLGQEMPDLAYHFHLIGFSSDLIITEWWLTVFSKNFPVELSCRVWDCFLLEGESFLFRAALGLCLLLRESLVGRAMEDCHAVLMRSGESVEAEDFFRAVGGVKASSKFIREMLETSS